MNSFGGVSYARLNTNLLESSAHTGLSTRPRPTIARRDAPVFASMIHILLTPWVTSKIGVAIFVPSGERPPASGSRLPDRSCSRPRPGDPTRAATGFGNAGKPACRYSTPKNPPLPWGGTSRCAIRLRTARLEHAVSAGQMAAPECCRHHEIIRTARNEQIGSQQRAREHDRRRIANHLVRIAIESAYSCRKAREGSDRAARQAGPNMAATAVAASSATTAT